MKKYKIKDSFLQCLVTANYVPVLHRPGRTDLIGQPGSMRDVALQRTVLLFSLFQAGFRSQQH